VKILTVRVSIWRVPEKLIQVLKLKGIRRNISTVTSLVTLEAKTYHPAKLPVMIFNDKINILCGE